MVKHCEIGMHVYTDPFDLQESLQAVNRLAKHRSIKEIETPNLHDEFETPNHEKTMGVEYYRVVIAGGVCTYDDLVRFRQENPVEGTVEWMP